MAILVGQVEKLTGVSIGFKASVYVRQREASNIKVGDTPDMVYIALGDPDEKRDLDSAAGQQTSWIYRTYWQQYEGTAWVGWHRMIVPAANGRGYVVFHEPIERNLYSTRVDEVIRVTFADGKVTTVDQRKR